MSHIYEIHTEKFGVLLYEADSIEEARKWAKSAHGVGPRSVWRQVDVVSKPCCVRCDSRPCCCKRDEP